MGVRGAKSRAHASCRSSVLIDNVPSSSRNPMQLNRQELSASTACRRIAVSTAADPAALPAAGVEVVESLRFRSRVAGVCRSDPKTGVRDSVRAHAGPIPTRCCGRETGGAQVHAMEHGKKGDIGGAQPAYVWCGVLGRACRPTGVTVGDVLWMGRLVYSGR